MIDEDLRKKALESSFEDVEKVNRTIEDKQAFLVNGAKYLVLHPLEIEERVFSVVTDRPTSIPKDVFKSVPSIAGLSYKGWQALVLQLPREDANLVLTGLLESSKEEFLDLLRVDMKLSTTCLGYKEFKLSTNHGELLFILSGIACSK